MSDKKIVKPVALAVGAALAGSLALVSTANADTGASPFSMNSLKAGYMLTLGEGSCGGDKAGDSDDKDKAEGSCGEGSCGADKKDDAEASCGGDAKEDGEGSCGEGSCGGSTE